MIARLRGTVWSIADHYIVLQVGGVGLHVSVPLRLFDQIGGVGDLVELHTYLHVRDNELSLYGFIDEEEVALFRLLMSVSGVGPKVALAVLSTVSSDALRQAVMQDEPGLLARVPGIGAKTARAIIFHLKDRLPAITPGGVLFSDTDAEVVSALTSLGFSVVEAQQALQSLPRGSDLSFEERVRQALAYFDRR